MKERAKYIRRVRCGGRASDARKAPKPKRLLAVEFIVSDELQSERKDVKIKTV